MVDMGTYEFNDLNTGENTREESFTNTYTEKKMNWNTSVLLINDYVWY